MKKLLAVFALAFGLSANAQTEGSSKEINSEKETLTIVSANFLRGFQGGNALSIRGELISPNKLGKEVGVTTDFKNFAEINLDVIQYSYELLNRDKARLFAIGYIGLNEAFNFHGEKFSDIFSTYLSVSPRLECLISNKISISASYRGSCIVTPSLAWGNAFSVGVGYKF